MIALLVLLIAYLLGAIPFGYLLVKWKTGTDVRGAGSGNIGATNVLRTTGRVAGIATLLLDIGKGYLAVWIAGQLTDQSPLWMSLAALAVMAGHAYPVFLKFHGGKAVASFVGAFLCLTPGAILAVLVVFVVTVAWTRHISMGSIVGAATFPLAVWLILLPPIPVFVASMVAGLFIIYRHSSNIRRLQTGGEHTFKFGGKMKNLAIIGAGSWGTALAIVLAPRFQQVRLWVYEADLAERMGRNRENDVYLPGFPLPPHVAVTSEMADALEGAEIVLSVMPSHLARGLYQQMLPLLNDSLIVVSATKGLENGSLLRVSEVIAEVLGTRFTPRVAVISGPTFAREVARFEPTALVVASEDATVTACVQAAFSGPTFRLYTSPDPTGVEIGGSIKNVVAIGAGVLHGMGLGYNATAALITRGLAEMTRLAVAMGGRPQTLAGLAGLGDLVLTCTGDLSRNRTVGVELAHGRKLEEIVGSMKMVAEGVKTTNAAVDLARRYDIEMPISEQMFQMLHFGVSPREAIQRLMERSLKGE